MKRFKLKILIFAIFFAPITFSLGVWQINRANEKIDILDSYNNLLNSDSVPLKSNLKNWQPVETVGEFKELIIYEDNAILDGKAGYKIYHLFENSDGSSIFIHRGFIQRNIVKNDLPEVAVPTGKVVLKGKVLQKTNNSFINNV